ncbi:MAG: DUF2283 domain-containing protein [Candidatus Sungbacteria bacterium]|nr:DUF2283 domain-containing protein [Candidatus Sungbacteria bacterium]
MEQHNTQATMSYEPEADVLRVRLNQKPIEYATEIGNFVVHFAPDGTPAYMEILDAKKFLRHASTLLSRNLKDHILVPAN